MVALGLLVASAIIGAGRPALGQVFFIVVSPATAVNIVGTEHTVTASVTQDGTPAGGSYTFEIIDGPNKGKTGEGPLFTYVGDGGPGTDTIMGCFVFEFCDTATKTWVQPTPTPTPTPSPTATATPTQAAPAAELPTTGTQPPAGSDFPWFLAGIVALGGLAVAGGMLLRRRAR